MEAGALPEIERHGHFLDRYDLVTVIAAAALFMLGVAGVIRRYALRIAFFSIGTLFFLGSAIQIIRISL